MYFMQTQQSKISVCRENKNMQSLKWKKTKSTLYLQLKLIFSNVQHVHKKQSASSSNLE